MYKFRLDRTVGVAERLRAAEHALPRLDLTGELVPTLDYEAHRNQHTAMRAIETLAATGILVETTGKKRDRRFACQVNIDRLRIGTELDRR